jgi:hypothetical protein
MRIVDQSSPNENIRLQNLWDGIETMAALMQMERGKRLDKRRL